MAVDRHVDGVRLKILGRALRFDRRHVAFAMVFAVVGTGLFDLHLLTPLEATLIVVPVVLLGAATSTLLFDPWMGWTELTVGTHGVRVEPRDGSERTVPINRIVRATAQVDPQAFVLSLREPEEELVVHAPAAAYADLVALRDALDRVAFEAGSELDEEARIRQQRAQLDRGP